MKDIAALFLTLIGAWAFSTFVLNGQDLGLLVFVAAAFSGLLTEIWRVQKQLTVEEPVL